jgi:hypothetical protein
MCLMDVDIVEGFLRSIFSENQLVRYKHGMPVLQGEDVVDVIRTFARQYFNGVPLLLEDVENEFSSMIASAPLVKVTPKMLAPLVANLVNAKPSQGPPADGFPPVGSSADGEVDKVRSASPKTGGTSLDLLQGLLDDQENYIAQLSEGSEATRLELDDLKVSHRLLRTQLVGNSFCSQVL